MPEVVQPRVREPRSVQDGLEVTPDEIVFIQRSAGLGGENEVHVSALTMHGGRHSYMQAEYKRQVVAPRYTRLAMRVAGVDKQWLLYLREKGVRGKLLKSTNIVPGDLGHVVLYDEFPVRDVLGFMKESVPLDYHVLQVDDLPLFAALAFEPETFKARMSEYVGARYPGKMVRLENCPFDYAWERSDGARAVLADASANNLGPVKATLDLNIKYAKGVGCGQGMVLFAKDEKAAQLWLKVIGPRDWLRLVRYDLPPKEVFFEAGGLVVLLTKSNLPSAQTPDSVMPAAKVEPLDVVLGSRRAGRWC